MSCKRLILVLFILCAMQSASAVLYEPLSTIDAKNNASYHNELGIKFMKKQIYPRAIEEFGIAAALVPDGQETGVYYNNLGRAYLALAKQDYVRAELYAKSAQHAFEHALSYGIMQIGYYENLVECYELQGTIEENIRLCLKSDSIYNKILLVFLYKKIGKTLEAQAVADLIEQDNPELIITKNLKKYLKK